MNADPVKHAKNAQEKRDKFRQLAENRTNNALLAIGRIGNLSNRQLYDFEDLLLNDGCTGIAVIGVNGPMEVQFDEHKLLFVYAHDLKPFEAILDGAGVERDDAMKLITEGEHLHTTDPHYAADFEQLCYRLAVGEPAQHANW